jgi:ATP synthase protein I
MASLGLEMGLAIVVGWGIGYWLDGKLGTEPYLMLLFLGFGIGAAFKALFRAGREAKRAVRESEE